MNLFLAKNLQKEILSYSDTEASPLFTFHDILPTIMLHRLRPSFLLAFLCLFVALPVTAQERVDEDAIAAIRAEGLENSQVMETLGWLTDVYGPRLTGSPQLDRSQQWILTRFEEWGISDTRQEPWGPFGLGWTLQDFDMNVVEPMPFPVLAYPKAWSPGIDGPVTAEVVIFDAESEEAFADYEGKLKGKVVLVEDMRDPAEFYEPVAKRHSDEKLLELANAVQGATPERSYSAAAMARYRLQQARVRFLYEQEPLAILDVGSNRGDYGSMFLSAATMPPDPDASWFDQPRAWSPGDVEVLPQITVASEHYNRMYRLLQRGIPVTVELNMEVAFNDDDPMEYNLIAEIPGSDPEIGDEVVMLGAHLDSWHAGTGATDNGAGSAVMMEAMRILKKVYAELGTAPRRTIRMALWTGEEQGLHGSLAYVNEHFADLPTWSQPPTAIKPDHDKLSAYYNMDNGTGKIRGIYLQGNEALRPIFGAWLAPFHDLGAGTVTISNTSSTDHIAFDRVGLPGFQFIQDPISYGRTHHSNMDTFDHAEEEDLKQAATIIASFVYHTAQRDEKLPRKPLELAEPAPTGSR